MRKIFKYLLFFILLVVMALSVMVWFSPYGYKESFSGRVVEEKILIDASVEDCYNYLGNSENAVDWSVYVDHITPLNSNTHKDGEIGSIRRCFKNKDESGIYWDEEILINEKNKRRRLNIYNMQNFSISGNNLLTEQLYVEKNGMCEITVNLFFDKGKSSWLDELKLYFAGYTVSEIFKGNLERIKMLNEN